MCPYPADATNSNVSGDNRSRIGCGKLCLPENCGKYRRTRNLRSRSFGFQRSTPWVNNSEIITISPAFGVILTKTGSSIGSIPSTSSSVSSALRSRKLTLMRAGNYDESAITRIDIREIRKTDEVIAIDTSVINFVAACYTIRNHHERSAIHRDSLLRAHPPPQIVFIVL